MTPQEEKKLNKVIRIDKYPNVAIVEEIEKVKGVMKKIADRQDPEQRDNISISNPDEISDKIVSSVENLSRLISSHFEAQDAKQAQYTKVSVTNTGVSEQKNDAFKKELMSAISRLSDSFPASYNYSTYLDAVLTELRKDKVNLKKIEDSLSGLVSSVKEIGFPEELTEYDRVKVTLSSSQIKELGKAMSVSVSSGGSGLSDVDRATLNTLATEATLQSNQQTSSEEALILRRLVKLLESNAVVDIANRQKVVVESIPTILGGYVLGANAASLVTGGAPQMNPNSNYFVQTWAGPVDPRFTNMEQAKINYNTGIRNYLSFS